MTDNLKLHFGIKTTQFIPYDDILRIWQEADAIPAIESAWLFDHPMPIHRADPSGYCLDGWTTLTALAAQTQRLRLGLMVASNANQTPPQLAKRAATVDVISNGRLEFGIGAGGSLEREHTAYGTPLLKPAESIRRLGEGCDIIRRMWTEDVVNFEGQYYQFKEIYCNPKPVQKPTPPFVIGGAGEQLTLRVVAQHANIWNYPGGPPYGTVEEFKHKSGMLDTYCAGIGRDPASILRSTQFIIDTTENPATARQMIRDFIDAGASHFVIGTRTQTSDPRNVVRWLTDEIITPLLNTAGQSV